MTDRESVAIVFIDLVASTELVSRLSPEDARQSLAHFVGALAAVLGELDTAESYLGRCAKVARAAALLGRAGT